MTNSSLTTPSFKDKLLSQETGGDYLVYLPTNSPVLPPQTVNEQSVGNPDNHNSAVEDSNKPQQVLITNNSMGIDSPSPRIC